MIKTRRNAPLTFELWRLDQAWNLWELEEVYMDETRARKAYDRALKAGDKVQLYKCARKQLKAQKSIA